VAQDLELKNSAGQILICNGEVIASGRRSLVIRLVGRDSIIKLLPRKSAEVEIDIYKQTDTKKSPFLRSLLAVYDPLTFPDFRALELKE